jgi:hypothetical protein
MFDKEIAGLVTSQNNRRNLDVESKYEYQDAHNGTHLMVHANPFFKYPKDVKQKMPAGKNRIKNPKEKEAKILFLNNGPGDRKTPYKH